MFSFAVRMIRDKYKTFLAFLAGSLIFLEMYVVLFPFIQEQSASFDVMMKSMPPEFFKAFNMDAASFSFANLESFLSTEYMSFLWPILAIILAIILANYLIINEIDKGTVETLGSLPVSRTRIFIERYLTGFLLLTVFSFLSMMFVPILAMIHGIDFRLANYFTSSLGALLFTWAVYSFAIAVSMLFNEKGKSNMVMGGVLTIMYVLSVVSSLKDNLEWLKYFSFFNYFNGSDLMAKNIIPDYALLIFVCFSIVSTFFAWYRFKKRDLAV